MSTALGDEAIDAAVLQEGTALFERMQGEAPGVFSSAYWEGQVLAWAMRDPSFKVDLFRFVDVFPTLKTREQVTRHIEEYLLRPGRELPTLVSAALKAATGGLTAGLAQGTIRRNVEGMAERFIVGRDAKDALPALKKLHKQGLACTVDLLGEAAVSDAESATYQQRYLDLVETLAAEAAAWPADEVIDRNHLGPVPRTNVSLKLSAMHSQVDPIDTAGSVAALKARVLPIFLRARELGVFLNVDLEQWSLHDLTYDMFEDVVCDPRLRDWPHVGIVVQAYLKSSARDVQRLQSIARARGAPLTVRLVKGAYWDYETVVAKQNGWSCPVFERKSETDANYEALSVQLLSSYDRLSPAFGSHNLRSLVHALVQAKERRVPERAFELQMLTGMAEPERKVLRSLGHRVRVYAPVGELLPGMAYLVRRLLENTSNTGFLRLSHHDKVDVKNLLARPASPSLEAAPAVAVEEFRNCAPTDFADPARRAAFRSALDEVRRSLPREVPVVVDGVAAGGSVVERASPNGDGVVVARVSMASRRQADAAVRAASAGWPEWRERALEDRAALLSRLADVPERDRDRHAALQCFEVGKPWREADADVAEAIDFCRYYSRLAAPELGPRPLGGLPGEENTHWYEGRGVCVVIAPWNFPLAILCGMSTAALVAGNTVVMKPAEQSSAVAWGLFEAMREAGFPASAVHFVPGVGEEVGPVLVEHPGVAQVAFTGSRAVGLSIVRAASVTHPGQRQVKRVVCEMGGKNAIIVDDDADLDEAVHGIVKSAFGFAGQKCSAASRVVVLDAVADTLVKRLVEAAGSLQVGPATDPGSFVGPVVDAESCRRLRALIASPGADVVTRFSGAVPTAGEIVPPTVFEVTDPGHRVMQEEFFGPVVAVLRVPDFGKALEVANATDYALTGAVYSRSPVNLERARRSFRVGNLYLNRGSTGAMVGRQPFGGFAMSGSGTKAGGPGYLALFADPRVVTENTMRRGFTPELVS